MEKHLFNILPDIFSNLVGGGLDKDRQLDEEDFKCNYGILYLNMLVKKNKQKVYRKNYVNDFI